MPKNFVLSYVEEKAARARQDGGAPGPVITIAREYGCPGIPVSQGVAQALSQPDSAWKMVDREVVDRAASDLRLNPETAEAISKSAPGGFFQEFISSFSMQQNPNDAQVKRAMANVIRAIAYAGNAVILGRGGVVIARDIKRSLHVKLYAPVAYRVQRVRQMDKLESDREALQKMAVVDRERVYLRDYLAGEELDQHVFDLQLNCATLTEREIIQTIAWLARDKFDSGK